jgi:succinoglycan biosynthesis transport protein ExoP
MYRSATSNGDGRVTPLYPVPSPSSAPPESASEDWMEREWDVPALLRALWRRRWVVAGGLAIAVLVAVLLLLQWPRAYQAEAVVLLDPGSQPAVKFDELLTGVAPDDQTISSEILVLRAPALAAEVVRRLRLTEHPDFNPDLPQILAPFQVVAALRQVVGGSLRVWLGLSDPVRLAPEERLERAAVRILSAFADRLEVDRIGRSLAVRVAVTSHDAGLAADVANALVDRYLADQLAAKHQATEFAGVWLDKRVADLRTKVEAAERAVEDYRGQSGLVDSNGVTVTAQQLAELNSQLILARGETVAARARLAQVQRQLQQRGDALSASEVLSSALIHRLKEQQAEVLRRRADLGQEFGSKHPRMLSVEAELRDIQGQVAGEVQQIVAGLSNAVAVAAAQEASLHQALQRVEAAAAEQGKSQVRLRALEREAEASRSLLQTFLQRYKQTNDQDSIQRPDARVLARAAAPETPAEPRSAIVLAGAAMVGLMAGLALAFWLELRESGLVTPAILRSRVGLPVLGLVPLVRTRRGSVVADEVLHAPLGSFAEAMRMVAGGLGDARAVLVTAAGPQEGKTSTALALARVLAMQGRHVLLVDADLRRSTLSIQFGLEKETGLADLLADPSRWPLPTASDAIAGIALVSAGSRGARADELSMSARPLRFLLEQWRLQFDHVIVDAAPALLISDVREVARQCDGVVLAVRWRQTQLAAIQEAATHLREAGATLLGAALTQVDLKRLGEEGLPYGDAGAYSAALDEYFREQRPSGGRGVSA